MKRVDSAPAAFGDWRRGEPTSIPKWFRKTAQENVLKLSGNIEAHESLVSFKVTGRIIALPVDEGMTLKAGDLLARLDNDDYRQQVAVDDAAVACATGNSPWSGGQPARRTSRPPSNSDARRAGRPRAKEEGLRALPGALRKGRNPGQTRDQAATNVTRAQATYDRASRSTTNWWKERAKKNWRLTAPMFTRPTRVFICRASGWLTLCCARPSTEWCWCGRRSWARLSPPARPIVTLADLDHLWVRVYVPETDLGKVHWGQAVDVRTDTYP